MLTIPGGGMGPGRRLPVMIHPIDYHKVGESLQSLFSSRLFTGLGCCFIVSLLLTKPSINTVTWVAPNYSVCQRLGLFTPTKRLNDPLISTP